MTQVVHYRVLRYAQSGILSPASGVLEVRPTLRRYENDAVNLTTPFYAPLIKGTAILNLEVPNPLEWCWEIFENVPSGLRRFVVFPEDPPEILYAGDLIDVDPDALGA